MVLFLAENYIKDMVGLFQIFTLILMLVSNDVGASPQYLNVASKASDHGTLVLGVPLEYLVCLAVSQLF